jgi:predicted transcriptional regulator
MGGVADFVGDVFEGVGDLVGDVVESVGKAVVDVVDFVVDDIIDPIVGAVGDVIAAIEEDPLMAIAQVALVATGNAWALPLLAGADVAMAGGDLGDVLKAAAISYVAGEVGSYAGKAVGNYVSSAAGAAQYGVTAGSQQATMLALQEAGMQTASQIAGRIVGSGAGASAAAVVMGRDPVQAFITGGVSAAVPAALGQVPGFTKLPPTAQQVISQAVRTQLSGGNITAAIIGSAIQASGVVTDILNQFDPDGTKMTDAQRAIATDILMGTATAALTGGDVNAAIRASLMKSGSKALGDMVSTGFKDAVKGVSDKNTEAEKVADKMDANIEQQKKVATDYNKIVEELNGRVAEQDRLKAEYDKAAAAQKANPTQATTDAANAAAKRYNDYATKLSDDYAKTYQPKIDTYAKELADIQTEYGNLETVFNDAMKGVVDATDAVKKELKPAIDASNKAFVEVMDPTFKAEEYRQLNGLGKDVDVYDHWLSKGQFEGVKTNNEAAQSDFSAEKVRLIQELAEKKGISLTQISDEDVKNFSANVDAKYKGNLNALKGASIQDFITGNTKSYDDLLKESKADGFRVDINGTAYGDWNKPSGYTPPSGMRLATAKEFGDDSAVLTYTDKGEPVWIAQDKGVQVWDRTVGDYVYKAPAVMETAPKLSDIQADDPEAWLVMAGSIPGDNLGGIDDFLYNFAKATMDLAKTTGNSTIINGAGNALKAGGGILESFNGLVVLAGKNPNDTAVGKFAEKLVDLGKASTTKEYQAAVADMQKMMGSGSGIMGTAKAIWGAATEYPAEFLAEIVGVEGMQELVPLMIGGGAAKFAQGLALAKGMGTTVAAQWGTRAGLAAAATSDIAESVGGSAQGAFNEAYQVARAQGMTEEQATQTALQIAARTGLTAGVITAASMGIGGLALEKAILGKAGTGELAGVIDALGKRIKEGGTVMVKEGVSEGIEEGLTQAYLEGQLYQLDPKRDITGNIASSSILGAIAGGGVSGGAYGAAKTGDVISNLLVSSNPTVAAAINDAPNAAAASTALKNLGIADTKLQANLLNTKYDADYTSTAEARAALLKRTDFVASDADVDALVGATKNTDLAAAVEKYVDPRVFDIDEVKAAAAAEGYTISDEEAAKFVGQKDEVTAIADARKQFNPLATTVDEAKQMMRDLGYTNMTDAEALSLAGQIKEVDAKKNIEAYVAPRLVTFDEAKKFLTDAGYTNATDEEVRQFVGQANDANFKESQKKKAEEYANPRVVTAEEAKAAYEALGLKKPTQDDIAKLVGQYDEAELAGKAETYLPTARYNSVMKQLDELAATSGQDQEILDAIELVKADIAEQVKGLGYKIDEQTGVLTDAITATEKNILDKVAEYEEAGMTRDEAIQKAVDDVAAELGTTREDLLKRIDTTEENLIKSVDVLSKDVGALSTKVGDVEANLIEKIAANEEAGMTRDEALGKAIDDVAAELGTTREDILTQIGQTESALTGQITDLSTDVQVKYDALTTEQKALADQLTRQGIDLNTAIDTAKTELTGEITTVRDTLGRAGATASQADLDAIINILENQGAYDANYDYNSDGVIDQADKVAIDRALNYKPDTDTPFAFTPGAGSKWAPTGVFKTVADEAEATRQAQAAEAERTRQANAAAALRTQRMGNINTMMGMLGQAPDVGGQQVTAKTPDPAKIGYIYDFNSIFANPAQEKMFASPYGAFAQGGVVRNDTDDINDELLKMLKG